MRRVRRLLFPERMPSPTAALAALAVLCAPLAAAAEPAIGIVEARAQGGVAGGGGAGRMDWTAAPAYVGVYGAHAVSAAPWTYLRAGLFLELGDRAAVGGAIGPRVALGDRWVVGAAAQGIVAPYTLWGGSAHLGYRVVVGDAAIVPSIELAAYAGGNDLPHGHVAAQALVGIGLELDAW